MQDSITTTFQDKTITIKELTVRQVREVFEQLTHEGQLFIDDLLDQPVPAKVVTEATGITLEELEGARPSELITLCGEVVKVNPTLASMIQRRIEAADRLEKIILSAPSSTGQSAS